MNILDRLELAKNIRIESSVMCNSKISFGLVNSDHNGVRATFSKGLFDALKLNSVKNAAGEEEYWVDVYPLEEKSLAIGGSLGIDQAYRCKLCGSGRKVAYNSQMVKDLVAYYQLDYSEKTSMTFYNIQFERINDDKIIAVVQIKS